MLYVKFLNRRLELENRLKTAIIKSIKRPKVGAIALALLASGCASTSPHNAAFLEQQTQSETVFVESFPELDNLAYAQSSTQDIFRVGDIADIVVYKVADLSGTYAVDRNGIIDFPLIGDVDVSGKNTADLQVLLEELYGETYLQDPNISVKIEKTKLGKLVVDGAVEEPGVFEVFEIVTLSEAIALAGGLTLEADRKYIYIVRRVDGETKVQVANLDEIRKYGNNNPSIYPGDIIYVQDSNTRLAYNEFLRTIPLLSSLIFAASR